MSNRNQKNNRGMPLPSGSDEALEVENNEEVELTTKEEIQMDHALEAELEKKPEIISASSPKESDSIVPVKKKSKGIEVKAIRAGYYQQSRKVEGDVFHVGSFEELGDWMLCLDQAQEKKHQAFLEEKNKPAGK